MTKTIVKIMKNGEAYNVGYNSKITIKKNWTKVDDFTLNQSEDKDINISVPTNSDYVDLTTAQSVWGVKTFTSAPVVPSKTTDASNTGTAVATEAQVYKKQDKLTLPSTPTSWNLVVFWANNKTFADGWAVPTWFNPWSWTTWQILRKTASAYEWSDEVWTTYSAWTNIQISDQNVISATDTTYSEVSKSDMDTWTWTTAWVVSAKSIADYVSGRVSSTYRYKGTKANYDALPTTWNVVWDVWNVEAEHTTAPKFPAWSNVAWDGTAWDVLGWIFNTSDLVDLTSAQTISWKKTFSTEPALPSKTTSATNDWTKPATEAQVYTVNWNIKNTTISVTQWGTSVWSFTTNQASASTLALQWDVMVTQTAYNNLPATKTTDWNTYIIYEDDGN